jgi:hypothetical protein
LAIERIEGNNRNFNGNKTNLLKCKKYMNDDMMHIRNSILKNLRCYKSEKGRERGKEGNTPCAVRAKRGKENPPYLH